MSWKHIIYGFVVVPGVSKNHRVIHQNVYKRKHVSSKTEEILEVLRGFAVKINKKSWFSCALLMQTVYLWLGIVICSEYITWAMGNSYISFSNAASYGRQWHYFMCLMLTICWIHPLFCFSIWKLNVELGFSVQHKS